MLRVAAAARSPRAMLLPVLGESRLSAGPLGRPAPKRGETQRGRAGGRAGACAGTRGASSSHRCRCLELLQLLLVLPRVMQPLQLRAQRQRGPTTSFCAARGCWRTSCERETASLDGSLGAAALVSWCWCLQRRQSSRACADAAMPATRKPLSSAGNAATATQQAQQAAGPEQQIGKPLQAAALLPADCCVEQCGGWVDR